MTKDDAESMIADLKGSIKTMSAVLQLTIDCQDYYLADRLLTSILWNQETIKQLSERF
jgi:hypothetical protein